MLLWWSSDFWSGSLRELNVKKCSSKWLSNCVFAIGCANISLVLSMLLLKWSDHFLQCSKFLKMTIKLWKRNSIYGLADKCSFFTAMLAVKKRVFCRKQKKNQLHSFTSRKKNSCSPKSRLFASDFILHFGKPLISLRCPNSNDETTKLGNSKGENENGTSSNLHSVENSAVTFHRAIKQVKWNFICGYEYHETQMQGVYIYNVIFYTFVSAKGFLVKPGKLAVKAAPSPAAICFGLNQSCFLQSGRCNKDGLTEFHNHFLDRQFKKLNLLLKKKSSLPFQ